MAEHFPMALSNQISGLMRLPAHRQFGVILGLAVVAALGVAVLLWALAPSYRVLAPNLGESDLSEAVVALDRRQIPHRLDPRSGALTVPENRVHEARLSLATQGLPRAQGVGFELLEQETGLGTSRMLETARYQRALEGELARSIVTLDSVGAARVHLALPRQAVFLRDRVKPSASVIVNLHPGRQLDETQIAGIVHMVASSVPELQTEKVTILDQRGRLLNQLDGVGAGGLPAHQLDYTRKVEDAYQARVEAILAPLVGADGMRVQTTAEIDFTQIESTREIFDSEAPALRSEQLSEEESRSALAGGVPGALTNQPPGAAVVVTEATASDAAQPAEPQNRARRSTRNFEVDRTIDHVRHAPATLSRLSIAVVVDDREVVGAEGERAREPRSAEEMQYLTALVREAVGLDEARGDRLNVVNASFREIAVPELLPPPAVWEQAWAQDLARYLLAGLGLMLLVMAVLRPVLKSLAQLPPESPALPSTRRSAAALSGPAAATGGLGAASGGDEQHLSRARRVAAEDPRLVAQVVRQWINDDGK